MTRDEETYFLRLMQVADRDTLLEHFTLKEHLTNADGSREMRFEAHYGHDEGYLNIKYDAQTRELLICEMNVGFPTIIGLNRSPLELRILCEHILDLLGDLDA